MTDPTTRCQPRFLLWLLLLAPLGARADVIDSVNSVRTAGCVGGSKAPPLQPNPRLDDVARRIAAGASLHAAQLQAGYHAVSSYSLSISDVPESGDVRHIIEIQFCPQATNPSYREIGVWRHGSDVWVAFAEPLTPPAQLDHGVISDRVLQLLNAARSAPHRCGSALYPPAPALTRDALLEHAAQDYAQDMAAFGYMDHVGRDGSAPHERITRSGYRWSDTGENLASGVQNADAVVMGWLASPEHCANIMNPDYSQAGVGVAMNARNDAGIYWALEFGHPAHR